MEVFWQRFCARLSGLMVGGEGKKARRAQVRGQQVIVLLKALDLQRVRRLKGGVNGSDQVNFVGEQLC